jgi:hypothetical protein
MAPPPIVARGDHYGRGMFFVRNEERSGAETFRSNNDQKHYLTETSRYLTERNIFPEIGIFSGLPQKYYYGK